MTDHAEETWVPIKGDDTIFTTRDDGRVVALKSVRGLFGSRVRYREGSWMRRDDELCILDPALIENHRRAKRFEQGSELMKSAPSAVF